MSKLKLINIFWDYFIKNSIELIADKKINWSIWQELNSYLQKIHPLLKIELTFVEDENSNPTLTISADGFKETIPTVQKIYDSKPQINNWNIEKFRQPVNNLSKYFITLDEIEVHCSEIFYFLEIENKKTEMADIILFMPDIIKNSELNDILKWLVLDAALGEFVTMTRIRCCAIESIHAVNHNVCKNIIHLKEEFEQYTTTSI